MLSFFQENVRKFAFLSLRTTLLRAPITVRIWAICALPALVEGVARRNRGRMAACGPKERSLGLASVPAWRLACKPMEDHGEMALVGVPDFMGNLSDGQFCFAKQRLRPFHSALDYIPMRCDAYGLPEAVCKAVGTHRQRPRDSV